MFSTPDFRPKRARVLMKPFLCTAGCGSLSTLQRINSFASDSEFACSKLAQAAAALQELRSKGDVFSCLALGREGQAHPAQGPVDGARTASRPAVAGPGAEHYLSAMPSRLRSRRTPVGVMCPLAKPIKRADTTWVEPRFEADIAYTEITGEGMLRHPSFKGTRIISLSSGPSAFSRKGGEPRTLCRLPNGGGRHPTANVPGDFAADRGTTAATATSASMKRTIAIHSTATDRRSASKCQRK